MRHVSRLQGGPGIAAKPRSVKAGSDPGLFRFAPAKAIARLRKMQIARTAGEGGDDGGHGPGVPPGLPHNKDARYSNSFLYLMFDG